MSRPARKGFRGRRQARQNGKMRTTVLIFSLLRPPNQNGRSDFREANDTLLSDADNVNLD
jgi:hypothetical protein